MVAGALRRRVWRDEHLFQWTPNFYIIFVAPPGIATKSTTIDVGMDLLQQIDGIKFGPDSGSWQGVADAMAEATEFFKLKPSGGDTPDNLLPQSAITVAISELGTFFRPDDSHATSFLTDMWDGRARPFQHKTRHAGTIEIRKPWLNLIGATTPSWFRANVPETMIGDGLTSRCVFVYTDHKRGLVAYPSRQKNRHDYHLMRNKLIHDLKEIAQLVGPYNMTEEAFKWGEAWYINHYQSRPTHMASDRYSGYIARKQAHLHKLAMILAASKRDNLLIEKADLEESEAILTDAEPHMLKVFESIGMVDEAQHLASLITYVRVHKWITSSDLYACVHNTMTKVDFQRAVRNGVEGQTFAIVKQGDQLGLSLTPRLMN